ncbi:hypothetical protein HAX54_028420 [Datura stramonium]|uniref:Uncharacterized protein n=1 Tax=Datura stramonium TaxID=4076 RepID=A0ABS8V710_DATST|nr:hypothetical protein [Datura stramonium]
MGMFRGQNTTVFFDLDDTLYPLSTGLAASVRKNIEGKIGYDFDYDEQITGDFVHGRLPYENLKPDPVLRSLLLSVPIRKVIFTNADKSHPATLLLLTALKSSTLLDIFLNLMLDQCCQRHQLFCKTFRSYIERALKIANINPHRTLFFEDSVRNITQAGKCRSDTVGNSQRVVGADYALESIHNIREALPQLWEVDRLAEVTYSGVAVETSVTA